MLCAMARRYDLLVLGGGTAGLIASITAAKVGARVALIDPGPPGGDCLFTGCVPSKTLLASAALAHDMRTADRLGLEPVAPRFEFARVMEHVQTVIERAGEPDSPERLRAHGVEVIRGAGRFTAPGAIEVDGRSLDYRAAVVATGSRPAMAAIDGLEDADPLTNEDVWELRAQPERLAVVGGGPVGAELAQAFARLGSRVDLLEASGRLLSGEEPEAGELVASVLRSDGVRVHTEARLARVEAEAGGRGMALLADGGAERAIAYDRLLVATGRRPVIEGLGLDAVGVELTDGGAIRVDERLRTTGDRVYAAGDVTGQLYFTHVAGYHGLVAAANALFRARRKVDHAAVPWVTFTDPEVARVGLSERQAAERLGSEPLVFCHDYAESDRALTAANARGFAKLVCDRRGRLLGATIAAPAAGESIAEIARLVRDGGRVADLSQAVHAYPTFSEGPARAADGWWEHRYLTPTTRRWLTPLLAALRHLDRPRSPDR